MTKLLRALLLAAVIPGAAAQAQLFRDTARGEAVERQDRKSTRLNSSHT